MYGERYMDTPAENQKGFDEASTLNCIRPTNSIFPT